MNIKNTSKESSYWNDFYDGFSFDIPSQFCVLTATEVDTGIPIVEFGCGNGRDSIFLARHGYQVVGVDLSSEAIKTNKEKTKDFNNIRFEQGDVAKPSDVEKAIASIKSRNSNKAIVYSRFFLHTLDDQQEKSFMNSLSAALCTGDKIYFEFRSKEDIDIGKVYGNHYRRFIDADIFMSELTNSYNFNTTYHMTGQGMAKYKSEDPFVTRIIAEKR